MFRVKVLCAIGYSQSHGSKVSKTELRTGKQKSHFDSQHWQEIFTSTHHLWDSLISTENGYWGYFPQAYSKRDMNMTNHLPPASKFGVLGTTVPFHRTSSWNVTSLSINFTFFPPFIQILIAVACIYKLTYHQFLKKCNPQMLTSQLMPRPVTISEFTSSNTCFKSFSSNLSISSHKTMK